MNSLEEIFEAFCHLKVLIIGDVMTDSYLWGKVDRISPEAPVPILNVQKREKRLGGAANVALNVQAMGAQPILCSVIGQDSDGTDFLELLNQQNLSTAGIVRSADRTTTIKHRIMSGSHHLLRVDQEVDHQISGVEQELLLEKITALLPSADVVVFEDYDKGVLGKQLIEAVITLAKDLKIPTVVDPKKRNFLHYVGVTLFKPNKKELKEGIKTETSLHTIEEVDDAIDKLQAKLCADAVMITLSEQGVYFKSEKESLHIPAHIRKIADVSGAGDTVISVAACCVALRLPAKLTTELANLSGGLVCEQVGVVPINKQELLDEATRLSLLTKDLKYKLH